MLSSFDHTNRSHQYNIDDPNEDIPNHIHETCLKKMYNKIIEFYYDVMDDIYLSFGDILEDEDELNGPELLQSELNLEVAQLQPSSLITIVFAESNKICRLVNVFCFSLSSSLFFSLSLLYAFLLFPL